jgi:Tol biopolymer transport system component
MSRPKLLALVPALLLPALALLLQALPATANRPAAQGASHSRPGRYPQTVLTGSSLSIQEGGAAGAAMLDSELPGPDWSRLAFASQRHGQWEVYIAGPDGSGEQRLTSHPAQDLYPRLDRGAVRVLFSSNRAGNWDLYVVNVDGSQLRRLTSSAGDAYNGAWSPDGKQIAFQAQRQGQMDIYVIDADGGNERRLTSSGSYDGEPAWSPDGQQIAFISRRQGGYHLWLMSADGSDQHRLTDHPVSAAPAWSPRGDLIAYDADGDGDGWQELYVVGTDGCCLQVLLEGSGGASQGSEAYSGSWSPDGRYVAFTHATWQKQGGDWALTAARPYWAGLSEGLGPFSPQWTAEWQPDWQTTDVWRPYSAVHPLPAYAREAVQVTWSGADVGLAGLDDLLVQTRIGAGGPWTEWRSGADPAGWQEIYPKIAGQTIYFRSRAVDRALNVEPWPLDDGHTRVTFYDWAIEGVIGDNRGAPLEGAGVVAGPGPGLQAFELHPADAAGHYRAYFAGEGQTAVLGWAGGGFGSLPETAFETADDTVFDVYLPPSDNLVIDGGFESGSLSGQADGGWLAQGDYPAVVTAEAAHTGQYGLRLGTPGEGTPVDGEAAAVQRLTVPLTLTHPTLSLLYSLSGGTSGSGTALTVSLDDGQGETVLLAAATPVEWSHLWADLSPWAGESVTLTVSARQKAGQPLLAVLVDEVSLGSAYPDLWLALDAPQAAGAGQLFDIIMTYGNRAGTPASGVALTLTLPSGLAFISAEPAPAATEPYRWEVAALAAGEMGQVTVTAMMTATFQPNSLLISYAAASTTTPEPFQGNNTAAAAVYVGHRVALPFLAR